MQCPLLLGRLALGAPPQQASPRLLTLPGKAKRPFHPPGPPPSTLRRPWHILESRLWKAAPAASLQSLSLQALGRVTEKQLGAISPFPPFPEVNPKLIRLSFGAQAKLLPETSQESLAYGDWFSLGF